VIVLGGVALTLRQFHLPMLATQSSARTPRFWWMLSAFLIPLGIANQVLFCDGLFLQLGIISLVAGGGIWVGDRLLERIRS
jgi:hypothetical protein